MIMMLRSCVRRPCHTGERIFREHFRIGPGRRYCAVGGPGSRAIVSGARPNLASPMMAARCHDRVVNEGIRRIGILLFADVEELDAVGPWEVLSFWCANWPEDGWEVFTFSEHGGEIRCAKGLTVRTDHSEASRPALDVLVYPGGRGTRPQLREQARLDWVRDRGHDGTLMTSVCTGSLVFAAAGLLSGRAATTHWRSLDLLAELDPGVDVQGDERFVDSGAVITAAGISAGIDMALHLVARLAGQDRARQVRRGIQYDPAPPV